MTYPRRPPNVSARTIRSRRSSNRCESGSVVLVEPDISPVPARTQPVPGLVQHNPAKALARRNDAHPTFHAWSQFPGSIVQRNLPDEDVALLANFRARVKAFQFSWPGSTGERIERDSQ